MANQEEILVKTGLDNSALASGMRQLSDQISNLSRKTGESAREGGKGFEFLGMKMGELKKSARELGHEFPLLGLAARAALNPIAGAVTVAIVALGYFKGQIDAINESLDKQAEKAAEPVAVKTLEAKQEAAREAAKSMEEYEAQLRKATSTEGDFQKAIDNTIAALQRKATAEQELAGMQVGQAQSRLQDMLKAGLISETQFAQQKGELEKKAAQESFDREKQRREQTISLQERAAGEANAHATVLDVQARTALSASGAAHSAAVASAGRKSEAEEAVKQLPMTQVQAAQAVEKYNANQRSVWRNLFGINLVNRSTDFTQAKIAESAYGTAGTANNQLKSAKAKADSDLEAADKAKIAADALKSKSTEAAGKAKEAEDKLTESKKQQSEWLESQTKLQKQRESDIDDATRRALAAGGGASGVAGVTSEDRARYMPTIAEIANSGHWVTHSMSGRGSSSFVHANPFWRDAQNLQQQEGFARWDYLHGNREQGDLDVKKIKDLRAKMIHEGAMEGGAQDVADDFKDWLKTNAIKVLPVMGE